MLSTPPVVKHRVCHWRISFVSHENDFLQVSGLWLKHREILLKMTELGCLQKCNTERVFVSPLSEIMMALSSPVLYIFGLTKLLSSGLAVKTMMQGLRYPYNTKTAKNKGKTQRRSFRIGTGGIYLRNKHRPHHQWEAQGFPGNADHVGSNIISLGYFAGRVWWNSLWNLCSWQLIWTQLYRRYVWFLWNQMHLDTLEIKNSCRPPERLFLEGKKLNSYV